MPALAVSYSGLLGGAERVLLDIARGLPEPPLLACPDGPLAQAAREDGLGVFQLRERSLELRHGPRDRMVMPLRIAAQAAEVRGIVAGQRPQVVLAWGMRAGLVLATAYPARRGRPPWLFQHHDLLPSPLVGRAVRTVAARADVVTTCSRCVAEDLNPGGQLNLRLLPPGVDLERFRPAEVGPSKPEVLVLGAIERWKRPDLALEAIALAARRLPELRARLIGAPIGVDGYRLLTELHERAEHKDLAGRIEFAGPLPDPRPALQRAACLLHCADREPYGMVIVEALASGLPVVAPASCGPTEIVDERCARLFDPGDPGSAAEALAQVLADPAGAADMSAAARARVEHEFDLEQTQRRYAELIDDLGGPPATCPRVPSPARTTAHADRPSTSPAARREGALLAIVTVTHYSRPELAALMASIERYLPGAQLVVVDSGSGDDSVTCARAWRDGAATVVELGENAGFGRGVNMGLTHVRRPVTALLNPDIELLDASLDAAARELAALGQAQLLAPIVVRPDNSRQDSAQHAPGDPALILHALAPGAALPHWLATRVEPWRADRPRRAGWAVGCAMLGRTEMLQRLGPFDERVFLYGEDLDLGLRATDAGVETVYWPAARVLHRGAHSTTRAFDGEAFDLLARRRTAVVDERRGSLRAFADDVLQRATFANRLFLKTLAGDDGRRERRQLATLRTDGIRKRKGSL
ncbi:MAG TPA: glycosyltransferase [Thermoleophilaceae bacterium]